MSASDAHESQQPLFGLTPEVVLVSIGLLAVVIGIVLLVVDSPWFGGGLLVAGALLLGAAIGSAARSDEARATRDRASAALAERRELRRLEQERSVLAAGRPARVAALGEAVYAGDDAGAGSLRAELEDLDRSVAAKDAEMAAVRERAEVRREREQLERARTAVIEAPVHDSEPVEEVVGGEEVATTPGDELPQPPVEPEPQPPTIPEPMPVPHEPPTPPAIPEPSPVPHVPPEPPVVPEPPAGGETEGLAGSPPAEEPVDPDAPTDEENRPSGRRRGR